MTEENFETVVSTHIREARVLGKEYGLNDEQVRKLEATRPSELSLAALEFKQANALLPKEPKPGDIGRRIASRWNPPKKESDFFKGTTNNNHFFRG